MRRFTMTAVVLLSLGLAGCSDSLPPGVSATASTPTASAAPDYAPSIFVLRGLVTVPYTLSGAGVSRLTAGEFASEFNVPSLLTELTADGYSGGASEALTLPTDGVGAFSSIYSESLVFTAGGGAKLFYAAESMQLAHPSGGAKTTPVAGGPSRYVEQITVLRETDTSASTTLPSYVALIHRGRVVILLICESASAGVVASDFFQLLDVQENALAGIPG